MLLWWYSNIHDGNLMFNPCMSLTHECRFVAHLSGLVNVYSFQLFSQQFKSISKIKLSQSWSPGGTRQKSCFRCIAHLLAFPLQKQCDEVTFVPCWDVLEWYALACWQILTHLHPLNIYIFLQTFLSLLFYPKLYLGKKKKKKITKTKLPSRDNNFKSK